MEILRSFLVGICLFSSAAASDVLVHDTGTKNGGDGPRQYSYAVVANGAPIMEFAVGMDSDSGPDNILKPPGWFFKISYGLTQHFGFNTATGDVSYGGPGIPGTGTSAVWYTRDPQFAVQTFEFGFDHAGLPGDVGWYARGRTTEPPIQVWSVRENWSEPVGTGLGPVHGPTHSGPFCSSFSDCSLGKNCLKPFGACQEQWGECVAVPVNCPFLYAPVCGCNGMTYTNRCLAEVARVSVAHSGACGQPFNPPYDYDADAVVDGYDNCWRVANPGQDDADADFVGNSCDNCASTILAVGADDYGCPPLARGDGDRDGDVDPADLVIFTDCVTGPALGPPASTCMAFDFDYDQDVDQSDFAVFQRCLTGENAPADPDCL